MAKPDPPSHREIADLLLTRLIAKGQTMAWLSRELGRNHAYIEQYVHRNVPRRLRYEDRERIAALLDIAPHLLGLAPPPAGAGAAGPAPSGLGDNAVPYIAEPDGYLRPAQNLLYFRMQTDDLAGTPMQIRPGDVLIIDINAVDLAAARPGAIMVFQMADRAELAKSHGSLVGQFLPPDKVVSNKARGNWNIALDDPDRPFLLVPRGTMLTVLRNPPEPPAAR